MATRLKSGAITKRSYTCFIASFLELQTSLLDDEHEFSGGFLFLAAIKDSEKPSTFRKASTIPQWQTIMH